MRAGADAVYFGLSQFNARARAKNFDEGGLPEVLAALHARGVKGYVTLNTLVFDHELDTMEAAIRACAGAGVDAVIVQDLGVLAMARAIAPGLRLHASTQMTCTDAESVLFARDRGVSRVVLARELSVAEIRSIREALDRDEAAGGARVELEVFVHGALCIAYSGQCLTSEAIGGRSANRGACPPACRLPYDLVVDGAVQELGDRAYLLSPQDLEGSAQVEALGALGVESLKIEGRLKGPAYVASTTRLYRDTIDGAEPTHLASARTEALQTYSRGSGPGFLEGVDHQSLVEARGCDHRGLLAGTVREIARENRKVWLDLGALATAISRGDGLIVEGGLGGEGELGSRVWAIESRERAWHDVERAELGARVRVWLGPDRIPTSALVGRRVFKNDDPALEKAVLARIEREPHREPLRIVMEGELGSPFVLRATSRRGLTAEVRGDTNVEQASKSPTSDEALREALARLGETTFVLEALEVRLPERRFVPISSVHRARRALTERLTSAAAREIPTTSVTAAELRGEARPPERAPPAAGLFVLCRTEAQARAALAEGADGVYLDFLELTGTGRALRALRADGAPFVGVAPPRIRKPGEEKIQTYLDSLEPDAILVRGLGQLRELERGRTGASSVRPVARIGDFSLNVTNTLSASVILAAGLDAFVPSFDLDATQLLGLLGTPFGPWAELVVHHPMPLFHMEHCVIAALLSEGRDHRTCGRPCEKHVIGLRDRAGMEHPVEADVGCRNTVFHAHAQSAATQVPRAMAAGVRRFRIELVREAEADVRRIVQSYRRLLAGETAPQEVLRTLRADGHYGVVRGSLRVMA